MSRSTFLHFFFLVLGIYWAQRIELSLPVTTAMTTRYQHILRVWLNTKATQEIQWIASERERRTRRWTPNNRKFTFVDMSIADDFTLSVFLRRHCRRHRCSHWVRYRCIVFDFNEIRVFNYQFLLCLFPIAVRMRCIRSLFFSLL